MSRTHVVVRWDAQPRGVLGGMGTQLSSAGAGIIISQISVLAANGAVYTASTTVNGAAVFGWVVSATGTPIKL